MEHLIALIESDDERYSFEWAAGDRMEILDKAEKVGYVLRADRIEYDEDGNAVNL